MSSAKACVNHNHNNNNGYALLQNKKHLGLMNEQPNE